MACDFTGDYTGGCVVVVTVVVEDDVSVVLTVELIDEVAVDEPEVLADVESDVVAVLRLKY